MFILKYCRILQSVIIEYETIDYAKSAFSMCNGIMLFNHKLTAFYSNRTSILSLD